MPDGPTLWIRPENRILHPLNGKTADSKIVVTPYADDDSLEAAEKFGIELDAKA